jgi:hypothetical protein
MDMTNPFFKPDPKCLLCNSEAAVFINKSFLEKGKDVDIRQFCTMYNVDFEKLTKEKLTAKMVATHFEKHCNAKGEALQNFETMKKRESMETTSETTSIVPAKPTLIPIQDANELERIHSLLADNYMNDLKVLDFSIREQLHHLKELKDVKAERKEKGVGTIDLIMKEENILQAIQFSLLNKIKVFQTGKLQQAQTQVLNSMNFLNSATMNLLGINEAEMTQLVMKKSQDVFITTVFTHFLKRLNVCMKEINLNSEQKALFLNIMKRELEGVENEIYKDFEINIKNANIIDVDLDPVGF